MIKNKAKESAHSLNESVIKGILEKKGLDIVSLHVAKIHSTVCDYFIICHGTSKTHTNAIAESIENTVKKDTGVYPVRKEGFANAEWILLDYLDVVVHVFQEPIRQYFQLEQLWADAPLERY